MNHNDPDYAELSRQIKSWAQELGMCNVGISDVQLDEAEQRLQHWLSQNKHGQMHFMAKHGEKRSRPQQLIPGTCRIISVSLQYRILAPEQMWKQLNDPVQGYVSCYALGRDYHKVLRQRLQRLADKIEQAVGRFGYRVFCDSAPVLEKALAEKAGIGWIGKHTNLIQQDAGSWFFLGEIYTDLPLPCDSPASNHCGVCHACIDACPTAAITAPYELDARCCISYLTIELRSAIPIKYRKFIGNRIYGCDDCQLVCPWNRFSPKSAIADFQIRQQLDRQSLLQLFSWSEQQFEQNLSGNPIRRIGYVCWQRNIIVALGNAPYSAEIVWQLYEKLAKTQSNLLKSHLLWSILEQRRQKFDAN